MMQRRSGASLPRRVAGVPAAACSSSSFTVRPPARPRQLGDGGSRWRVALPGRAVSSAQLRVAGAVAAAAARQQQQRHGARGGVVAGAAAKPTLVLDSQPMLSDLLTEHTGPLATISYKVLLDIALPILALWGLFKVVDWAADQARIAIDARVAGEGEVVEELKRRSTLVGLVLLAMRSPTKFLLPPWLFAYTLRTALNIVDLVVNKYRDSLHLPPLADYAIKQVSAQLVPLDTSLEKLLAISGVLFVCWFFVQLKDILIREVILVRAIRRGQKELERVYLPISSLITWATVVACGLSICSSLGVNLKPLLAVGGAGGIAAGFASQQLLLNVVSGISIFLTRPFVTGDQIVFAGGANLEGTVEGVEITRTTLRIADGTLVALPNKLVSDLIVYNRTRTLEAVPTPAAAGIAATAPLRRVLCFQLQLARELEPQLDAVRSDVRAFLNRLTRDQLRAAGLAPEPSPEASSQDEHGGGSPSPPREGGAGVPAAAVAQAVAAAAGVAAGSAAASAEGEEAGGETAASSPEPEPLLVSITLQKMTAETISLFVRCEMLVPAGGTDAVERQTEDTLLAISALVKDKWNTTVLW